MLVVPGSEYKPTPLRCLKCECGIYVSGYCCGKGSLDFNGSYHNHCSECPGLGLCLGSQRWRHCGTCGRHYANSYRCPCFDEWGALVKYARRGDRAQLAGIYFYALFQDKLATISRCQRDHDVVET